MEFCGIPPLPVATKLLSLLLEHSEAIYCDVSFSVSNSTKPELGLIPTLLISTVPLTPNWQLAVISESLTLHINNL